MKVAEKVYKIPPYEVRLKGTETYVAFKRYRDGIDNHVRIVHKRTYALILEDEEIDVFEIEEDRGIYLDSGSSLENAKEAIGNLLDAEFYIETRLANLAAIVRMLNIPAKYEL